MTFADVTIETFVGAAAASCTTASYIPQLLKCWTTGETGDLSLKMLLLLACGLVLWMVYGLMRGDAVIILANGVSLSLLGCILISSCGRVMGERSRTGKRLSQRLLPVLGPDFFGRNADTVARDLIGKALVRKQAGTRTSYVITETEAYLGEHDLASHSARGRTQRTEVMFGPPGVLYIYLVYGMHCMINVVTGAPGHAAAVLIRSAGPFNGPGRLSRGLQISPALNRVQAEPSAGLWFEDAPIATSFRIHAGPRIGVEFAGPVWSRRKLRFLLEGA